MKTSSDFTEQNLCEHHQDIVAEIKSYDLDKAQEITMATVVSNYFNSDAETRNRIEHDTEKYIEQVYLSNRFIWQNEKQKNNAIFSMKQNILRYIRSEVRQVTPIKDEDKVVNIPLLGGNVKVLADYAVQADNSDFVNIIKIKGAPALSDADDESWESYCLMKLGKKLFPNKKITVEINYLQDETVKKNITLQNENFFNPVSERSYKTVRVPYTRYTDAFYEALKTFENENPFTCSDCTGCSNFTRCNYEPAIEQDTSIKTIDANTVPLTVNQKTAAESFNNRTLIAAKAGTGKTTVTALNILNTIKKGVAPSDILMTSYTVNGANEIVERVQGYINGTTLNSFELESLRGIFPTTEDNHLDLQASEIQHGTLASFCQGIITEHFEELGFSRVPNVISDDSRQQLINNLLDRFPKIPGLTYNTKRTVFSEKTAQDKSTVAKVSDIFTAIKKKEYENPNVDKYAVVREAFEAVKHPFGYRYSRQEQTQSTASDYIACSILVSMYEAFKNEMKAENQIEFYDMPFLVLKLYEADRHFFDNLKIIYVDEFQDTNPEYVELLKAMLDHTYTNPQGVQTPCKLFCVGDTNQALFGFMGASSYAIVNFDDLFGRAEHYTIDDNFRCNRTAITFINNYMSQLENDLRLPHVNSAITSSREDGEPVDVKGFNTQAEKFEYIANCIEQDLRNGIPASEICVQLKSHKEIAGCAEVLQKHHIPITLACPVNISSNSNVGAACSYILALIADEQYEKNKVSQNLLNYVYTLKKNQDPDHDLSLQETSRFVKEMDFTDTSNEQVLARLHALDPDGKDELYQSFLDNITRDNNKKKGLNAIKQHVQDFIFFGQNQTFRRQGTGYNAVSLNTPWSAKGLEYESCYAVIDGYDTKNLQKPSSHNSADMNNVRNILYTMFTRISGNTPYTGQDGQQHKGTLHIVGLNTFGRDPHTNTVYVNRFLRSAKITAGQLVQEAQEETHSVRQRPSLSSFRRRAQEELLRTETEAQTINQ